MTQASPHHCAAAGIALGTLFLFAGAAPAQTAYDLPPTLRAANEVKQQSASVIDQLIGSSAQRNATEQTAPAARVNQDRQTHWAATQAVSSNELRVSDQAEQPVLRRQSIPKAPRGEGYVSRADSAAIPSATGQRRVQSASFERADQVSGQQSGRQHLGSRIANSDKAWDEILKSSTAATQSSAPEELLGLQDQASAESFLAKEQSEPTNDTKSTAALIKKISINLMFVLAAAFGFLLLVKQWQKGKSGGKAVVEQKNDALNVSQILPLSNGASLHVVQGSENKFLVAIDSGGIKSVNVLTGSFEDAMTQVETRQQRRQSSRHEPVGQRTTDRVVETIDPTDVPSEIDEKLIKMLLQRAPQAA
ncbi:flagellar biosynthetic protein FliO [Planctomycetes bacterium K23_9]|uniref:Flagellar biosynthesis protein, FliO n=1 Tax=Stieleria marina TaxID=1930275 RepID=A0A517NT03_9BACT|nr:hypothetical protein K239x_22160 [Planctomycetes bacterium K23_9]